MLQLAALTRALRAERPKKVRRQDMRKLISDTLCGWLIVASGADSGSERDDKADNRQWQANAAVKRVAAHA